MRRGERLCMSDANNTSKDQTQTLNYKVIKDELETVIRFLSNKIERGWPEEYKTIDSAREFFLLTEKVAVNTFFTIVFICADDSKCGDRSKKFSLSIPPLSRTILESLMTVIFVLVDIRKHVRWFYNAGWLEFSEALVRYQRDYGDSPEWSEFISKLEGFVRVQPQVLKLTEDEIKHPKRNIGYWPNPGKMARYLKRHYPQAPSIAFLEYLNDWFYKTLSGQSHLNAPGLTERGGVLADNLLKIALGDNYENAREIKLDQFRKDQIWIAMTLMVSLLSEIEMHFHFGANEKLKYIWGVIIEYSSQAKEVYLKRYSSL